ncbi:MAG: class III extradiol ring-cleavage dioxygenase family protein [Verrucomicrobiota bacterium]
MKHRLREPMVCPACICAVLMPHAPILVPDVGGERGGLAEASCRAMRAAAACVMGLQPETVVVISPHSPRKPGAFGLCSDDRLQGSFEQFDAPQARVSLPNDRRLANAIGAEAQSRGVETWQIHNHGLDHGALVPLWFLAQAGWAGPTVLLSLNYPGEGGLTSLGEAIAAAANVLHRHVAIIASGDMSHRLTANAPCGFHPRAHRFDETFISLVRAGDYQGIQSINSELREVAAEDAVDSTLVAAAAAGWNATGHKVLSYEGPFGVGYGVAILFAEKPKSQGAEATPATIGSSDGAVLPGLARRSVEAELRGSSESPPAASGEYLSARRGVFVTVRRRGGELRGCVGTPVPVCANLVAETWRNARLAAFRDTRFPSVAAEELAGLRFHVSVLHSREDVLPPYELDPRRYGVIVSAVDGRCGVLLPGIESINTGEAQLRLAREKGWIGPDEPVKVERFQVDHFEEPA